MLSNLKALWLKVNSTLFASSKGVCMDLSSIRCWNQVLNTQLIEVGFKQTPSDPCIYTHHYQMVYVFWLFM